MFHVAHLDTGTLGSGVGRLTFVGSDAGLRAVLWPIERDGRVRLPEPLVDASHPTVQRAVDQVHEYFDGARTTFDVPLDLHGTPFQVKVWGALTELPFGTTTTYGALAERLGGTNLARAVGAAVGRNPVSIIVPCHRVVGAGGALTGFAGGLDTKRRLLALESR